MGKAKVIENKGKGLYTIELDLGSVRRQQKMDVLAFEIDELLAARADLFSAVAGARIDLDAARTAYDEAVVVYIETAREAELQSEIEDAATLLEEPTRALTEAGDALRAAEAALQDNQTEARNLERKYARLEATPGFRLVEAWCADYTTFLDEDDPVSTLEVPNEPQAVLVAPGGTTAQDAGNLMRTHFMSAAQAFYNAAILPGWQKTMPTYRFGTLTGISEDLRATIQLEFAASKAQGLSVNRAETLVDVITIYLESNIAAFSIGDSVLVEFRDRLWTDPRLIGFKSHPKPNPGGIHTRVTDSGLRRKLYRVDRGVAYSWYAPPNPTAAIGQIGWAGPDGGVSWETFTYFTDFPRMVYSLGVEYAPMALFPDRYFYNSGSDYVYPVILGCSIVGDTIVVVAETVQQSPDFVEPPILSRPEAERVDVLAIKRVSLLDDPDEAEVYVITSWERQPVTRASEWVRTVPVGLSYSESSGGAVDTVKAASCQGFSISPDGRQFVYCDDHGATHVELTELPSGVISATTTTHGNTLEASRRVEKTIDLTPREGSTVNYIINSTGWRLVNEVSGFAIVGAVWTGEDGGPTWVYWRPSGVQTAEGTKTWLSGEEDTDQSMVETSAEVTSLTAHLDGGINSLILDSAIDFAREDLWTWTRNVGGAAVDISRSVTDYDYQANSNLDEIRIGSSPSVGFVQIPPQSGLYVADRFSQTGFEDTSKTRLVRDSKTATVLAGGTTAATSDIHNPMGADPDEAINASTTITRVPPQAIGDEPTEHPWIDGGGGLVTAPPAFNHWEEGYSLEETDPFHMNPMGKYWYRPVDFGVALEPFRSAQIGGAVFLSTAIDGTAFHYLTDASDIPVIFNTEAPAAFDYIVAG